MVQHPLLHAACAPCGGVGQRQSVLLHVLHSGCIVAGAQTELSKPLLQALVWFNQWGAEALLRGLQGVTSPATQLEPVLGSNVRSLALSNIELASFTGATRRHSQPFKHKLWRHFRSQ